MRIVPTTHLAGNMRPFFISHIYFSVDNVVYMLGAHMFWARHVSRLSVGRMLSFTVVFAFRRLFKGCAHASDVWQSASLL